MSSRGFTLLELLIVITLLTVAFGVIGFSFVGNIFANLNLRKEINEGIKYLSIYNQLSKQFFSAYQTRGTNIFLTEDRLSFYTLYPVFFEGAVRAEYYVEEKNEKKFLVYEEFPYVDGNLGFKGKKKIVLGEFEDIKFEAYDKSKEFKDFRGTNFPEAIFIFLNKKRFTVLRGS